MNRTRNALINQASTPWTGITKECKGNGPVETWEGEPPGNKCGACRIGPFRVARMCNFCFRTPKKPIRRGNAASIARCTFQGCREILRMSEHS